MSIEIFHVMIKRAFGNVADYFLEHFSDITMF